MTNNSPRENMLKYDTKQYTTFKNNLQHSQKNQANSYEYACASE